MDIDIMDIMVIVVLEFLPLDKGDVNIYQRTFAHWALLKKFVKFLR